MKNEKYIKIFYVFIIQYKLKIWISILQWNIMNL